MESGWQRIAHINLELGRQLYETYHAQSRLHLPEFLKVVEALLPEMSEVRLRWLYHIHRHFIVDCEMAPKEFIHFPLYLLYELSRSERGLLTYEATRRILKAMDHKGIFRRDQKAFIIRRTQTERKLMRQVLLMFEHGPTAVERGLKTVFGTTDVDEIEAQLGGADASH